MSFTSNFIAVMILVSFLVLSTTFANPNSCTETFFILAQKENLRNCRTLTTLGAEFGWEINRNNEHEIGIFFGARLDNKFGWVAWGVNPGKTAQMVGSRTIVGIISENGSVFAATYNITSDTKLGCKLQPTTFEETQNEVLFRNISIDYRQDLNMYIIQAKVVLTPAYDISHLSHVWQVGYDLEDNNPKNHPTILQNVDSAETINLRTGFGRSVDHHRHFLRKVHGILNILGWGTLLPAGVIVARYFKYPFETSQSWDIRLHVCCQFLGYFLGTSGWAVGLYLGHLSKLYAFRIHRLYAIFVFAFTTLQTLAIRLRPGTDDEYRKYWNMYHHILGYALLAVISINIFHGIDILKPKNHTWKWIYIGILIAFAAIVTVLEIYSWVKFNRNRSKQSNVHKSGESGGHVIGRTIPQPLP